MYLKRRSPPTLKLRWAKAGTRANLSNLFVEELIAIINFISDFKSDSGLRPPKPTRN